MKQSPNDSNLEMTSSDIEKSPRVVSSNNSSTLSSAQINSAINTTTTNKSATMPHSNTQKIEKEKPKKKSKLSFLSRKKSKDQSS